VSLFQASIKALVLTSEIFPFDQQGQTFIEAQVMISGLSLLLLPGFKKAVEFKVFELGDSGLHEDIGEYD
jgi:hypothetical protein